MLNERLVDVNEPTHEAKEPWPDAGGRSDNMADREALQRRIAELEAQLAETKRLPGYRIGMRKRSATSIAGLPLYEIALGPDPEQGQVRGHARAVFAVGDIATGVIALGGLARGLLAVGGLSLGAVSFGGLSVGALAAIGGLAIGTTALGGVAVGGVAIGGGTAGYYACGGAAVGAFVIDPMRRDPEAIDFFHRHAPGLAWSRLRPHRDDATT
jgi:hypothetical protein